MTDIDGRWQIEAPSPRGKQVFTLDITTAGDTATGTVTDDGVAVPLEDGKVDGDTVTFKMKVAAAKSMSIGFTLKFDGDELTGKLKAGVFPSTKATGHRVS